MTDTITLTGLVATPPNHLVSSGNLPITTFRLASTQRRFDRSQNRWVDAGTNWYTVTAFRQLAMNAASSLQKGDRVVVTGRLRLREWTTDQKTGMNVDVEADALGHDLTWGTARWQRTTAAAPLTSRGDSDSGGDSAIGELERSFAGSPALPSDGDGPDGNDASIDADLLPAGHDDDPPTPF